MAAPLSREFQFPQSGVTCQPEKQVFSYLPLAIEEDVKQDTSWYINHYVLPGFRQHATHLLPLPETNHPIRFLTSLLALHPDCDILTRIQYCVKSLANVQVGDIIYSLLVPKSSNLPQTAISLVRHDLGLVNSW